MPRHKTMRTEGTPAGVAVASAIASGSAIPRRRASSSHWASVSSGSPPGISARRRLARTWGARDLRLTEVDDADGGQHTYHDVGRIDLEPAHGEVRAHPVLVMIVLKELAGRHEVDGKR